MESPRYKAAMLAMDRLLDEIDETTSEERAAILYALIENQQAILTEELQQYRQRCENLYRSAERLACAPINPDFRRFKSFWKAKAAA